MKKFFIIILGVVACCNTCLAQSTFKYKSERNPWDTYIGAKGGAMYCKLTNIKNSPKITGFGGLFAESFLTKHFSVQPEFMFAHQGANSAKPFKKDAPTEKFNYQFNFIYIDFLLKQYIGNHFSIYSGFHTGKAISMKCNGKTIKSELNTNDFAIPVGASVTWKNLSLDARYNIPIKKIAETTKAKQLLGPAKNNSIMVSLGYQFKIF